MARMLSIPLVASTAFYGEIFEHFIIVECMKLRDVYYSEYRFTYLRTKDDAEIDLVVERPGQPILFVEIKSTVYVTRELLFPFINLTKDFGECEAVCFSDDSVEKMIDHVRVLPWKEGLRRYFTLS